MKKREYRSLPGLELRQESGEPLRIRGYAALFNTLSEELFFGRERILPGAFTKSLSNDIRALVGHDPNLILGRTKSRTLEVREDEKGLYVEIQPPNTTLGHDVVESVRRGDLDQMSFGFYPVTRRTVVEDKKQIVELLEADVFDVSVVAFPAYKNTSVSTRALWPDGIPEDLEQLRGIIADEIDWKTVTLTPVDIVKPLPVEIRHPSPALKLVEELEQKYNINLKSK